MRTLHFLLGVVAVVLAVVGLLLPILPTTPFLILAAWAFGRSSPRFESWLLNHPHLGPPLRAWRQNRSISRRAKFLAVSMMAGSFAYLALSGIATLTQIGLVGVVLGCCAAFILTRPNAELRRN